MAKETKRPRTTKSTEKTNKTAVAKSKTSATTDVMTATAAQGSTDIEEAIRRRAYELYDQRGRENGLDLDDWLRAENEVRERFGLRAA